MAGGGVKGIEDPEDDLKEDNNHKREDALDDRGLEEDKGSEEGSEDEGLIL